MKAVMKKTFALLLGLLILSGCAPEPAPGPTAAATAPPAVTANPIPAVTAAPTATPAPTPTPSPTPKPQPLRYEWVDVTPRVPMARVTAEWVNLRARASASAEVLARMERERAVLDAVWN